MWRRTLLLGTLALSVVVAPAGATIVEDPVSVRITGDIPVARPGQAVRVAFELRAARTVEISNLAIEGDGWAGKATIARPPRFAVMSSASLRVEFDAIPRRPDSRLVLRYDVEGRTYREVFDLSPAADQRRRAGGGVRVLTTPPDIRRTGSPNATLRAEPRGFDFSGPIGKTVPTIATQPPVKATTGRLVQVTGTFVYKRDYRVQATDPYVWLGVDGLTVQIWENDYAGTGQSVKLGEGTTDAFGNFDVSFFWGEVLESQPDILVFFIADNSKFAVLPESDPVPYFWAAGPYPNFTGTHLDLGGLTSPSEFDYGVLNILTDLMRDWRWLYTRHGVDLPPLTINYPITHNDVSHYHPAQSIHFTDGAEWMEDTHAHEYSHHLVHERLFYNNPSYCNTFACEAPPDCGHKNWCEENPPTAWGEGVPDYFATVETESYAADYGVAALHTGSHESIVSCWDCLGTHYADPFMDESHATAVLQDIADSAQDTDAQALTNGTDALALGDGPIWNTMTAVPVINLEVFIAMFRGLYPQYSEQLWQTLANNQINQDVTAPGAPVSLHSTSHTAGVESGDATPTFAWTRPSDDFSGVAGYSVQITAAAGLPDAVKEMGNVTTWTSPRLNPGRYQVTLRAVDRAGNWSATCATWGELVIREAGGANLGPYQYAGWDHAVVPRASNDATVLNVDAPTSMLTGNAAGTWWNACGKNTGESSTGIGWLVRAFVDGADAGYSVFGATPAGGVSPANNRGPVTVRGGRHTFGARMDDDEEISETSETDNAFARQWIWTPYVLLSGSAVTRAAPPDRIGGWDDIEAGQTKYFNCDGFRVANGSGSYWRAMWMRVDDPADDFDCRLHFPTAAADTGFAGYFKAYSRRASGCLEAVLYNRLNTSTVAQWDVGVLNASGGTGTYYSKLVSASKVFDGDSVAISFPAGEMLRLREFDMAVADTGWYCAKVTRLSGSGPVYMAWYDTDLQAAALADETVLDTASTAGDPARFDVHLGKSGSYGLAIYRDPKDGTAALSVLLEFGHSLPDYEPVTSSRWHSPLVPHPAADGTMTVVALPDTLYGDVASTYLNFAVCNSSYGDPTSSLYNHVCLDGVAKWGTTITAPNPRYATAYNGTSAKTVSGGRHTLSLRIDPQNTIDESSETNNGWGEQWVWGPALLSTTLTRSAPPDPTGGWDELTDSPYGIWYDCDGLRVQQWAPVGHSAYWGAFAVMPGDTSDVDVRLHEVSAGAQTGFRSNLVRSTWGPGQSDYCLVNFNLTAFRTLDVGLLRGGDGTQVYTAQVVKSVFRATNPNGVYGPYSMAANALVTLHEFWLDAGTWELTLANTSGTVDWGLGIHDGTRAYHTKNSTLTNGLAWMAGAGAGERLVVNTPTSGYYAVVVSKAGSADLALAGSYTLGVNPATLDVPGGGAVARTSLAAAYPNPFRRDARVTFELARECAVSLEVYDLHGARVRTLAAGTWPAGRHEARWDATADSRRVAPGIYFVRFTADGVVESRRVIKIE